MLTTLTNLIALPLLAGSVSVQNWGSFENRQVHLYTLTNARGMRADVTDYGATLVRMMTPDRNGKLDDVVLGFETLAGYRQKDNPYIGCTVGRYSNRIAKGRFKLNGVAYRLATNNGPNSLHGGLRGFDKKLWKAQSGPGAKVTLSYVSPHMEEGYPGKLTTTVTFTLTDSGELRIDYLAKTDRPTVASLTNHSYFNLGGKDSRDALDHLLKIHAVRFLPIDATSIPTGEAAPVAATPFDFRTLTPIGARIDADNEQIRMGSGYDHTFIVSGMAGKLRPAARAVEPTTGRTLDVLTTEPGVQLYTANFLTGELTGKNMTVYPRRYAFCLETQRFPDTPNKAYFPSATVTPDKPYRSTTVYRFGVTR